MPPEDRFATVRRGEVADRAALAIARATSGAELALVLADVVARLTRGRDHVVLTALDLADGTYDVLGGSEPSVAGVAGRIDGHPILATIGDLTEPTVIHRRDRRHRGVTEALAAAGARNVEYVPLRSADATIGCVLLLRRSRPRSRRRLDELFEHAAATLDRLLIHDELERTTAQRDDAAAAIASLTAGIRALDTADSPADAAGHVLGSVRELDPTIIGAVVGIVVEGVVTDVAAIGTTPRSFVESLSGTRLDGFPIGQQMLASSAPIVAGLDDVSLATRTKLMDPLGAQAMLAAGGREGGTIRIVVSCYRSVVDPPPTWALASIASLLDAGAGMLARIERRELISSLGDAVGRGVLVRSAQGSTTFANEHARALLGNDVDELPYESVDGRVLERAELPWARASAGDRVKGELLRLRSTGRIHRVTATPAPSGMAVVVFDDVTDDVDERAIVTDLHHRRAQRGG